MKVSLCITTFNEEKTISKLLESIFNQTRLPDEVVIVDGGSTDETMEILSAFQASRITKKCDPSTALRMTRSKKRISIARGRNLAVKNARYPIIAMTDGGCVADKRWLEKILSPFQGSRMTQVVAGFYRMIGKSDFQKALKPFLGTMPDKFNNKTFLPSTRSIAFKKSVWKIVGGFNEKLDRVAEDTDFNLK